MQLLMISSFIGMVLTSLFIGQAFSGDYAPYKAFVSAALFMIALFVPFLSEYNVLHRGFSKIGSNFRHLMKSEPRQKGDVEIILPGHTSAPPENYALDEQNNTNAGLTLLICIAFALLSYDAVSFYILGDGHPSETGPISNF